MHQQRLEAGLRPDPLGELKLQRSLDLLAGFKIGVRDKGRRKGEKTAGDRQMREGTEKGRGAGGEK